MTHPGLRTASIDGGAAGVQFRNADEAAAIAHRLIAEAQVAPTMSARKSWQRALAPRVVWKLVGDSGQLLSFFRELRAVRRARRDNRGLTDGLADSLAFD